MIRKEAWIFYRSISGVRLCWELEEPQGPEGCDKESHSQDQILDLFFIFKVKSVEPFQFDFVFELELISLSRLALLILLILISNY